MPCFTLLRVRRIIAPTRSQKWIICTNETSTRRNSTQPSSKILERLENRTLIKVAGNESSDFLQGLVTNDMRRFDEGAASIYALFLNIKGRVMCDSIIYKALEKSIFYVECDARITGDLQKHLKMYKIRRKVDIESLGNKMKIWSVFDAAATEENDDNRKSDERTPKHQTFPCGALGDKSTKSADDLAIYGDPRIPDLSLRILSDDDVTTEEIVRRLGFDVETGENAASYREFRYRLGIGEGTDDFPSGKAFPLEINSDYLHGVSFHKGCYIGQELTARTYHTGVVRKRLMPLTMDDSTGKVFNYDDSIVDETGKVVGKFRGRAGNIGLGLMRISEALSARTVSIHGCRVTVMKPRWWPKETQDKATADTRK